MDKNELRLRSDLIRVNRLLAEQGLIRSSDGNISVRLNAGFLLITPSGVYKRSLSPEDLVVIDMDGIRDTGPACIQLLRNLCTWKHTGSVRRSTL